MEVPELLEEALALFGKTPRPRHFTNYTHCCECAEHDETLGKATLESLSYEDLPLGWDPLCFISPEGFQYYFPALVRLTLEGTGDNYFIDRLVFHLELDGQRNSRYMQFTPEQRDYVVRLLHYLVENRAQEIDENRDADNLFRTIDIWEERDV